MDLIGGEPSGPSERITDKTAHILWIKSVPIDNPCEAAEKLSKAAEKPSEAAEKSIEAIEKSWKNHY
ncbi:MULTISPECIES: hypothetical protein [Allobacillus]|uniref:Uncharacterized protein n=1 Tax=Allobacillus salarius TaxID=1955272 RepID=A0A556PDE5_9BACI|nr:hypothetical protein [Allobacillus salarius]TSJ62393.1 hypothetical protein FPQ13_10395 [Allobacillus salarius]